MDNLFGWEMTFRSVKGDITKKEEILIAFVHWILIKKGFRCIGVGHEQTLTGQEDKSELLPDDWNQSENYSMRYVYRDKLFIFHALQEEGKLILNLMKVEDLAVSNISLGIDDYVKDLSGSIETIIPQYNVLIHDVTRDLVDTVVEKTKTTTETQTQPDSIRERPRPGLEQDRPRITPRHSESDQSPRWDPFDYGRADLNPFGPPGGGGGMLFDPFSPQPPLHTGIGIPGGIPRPPPGARFDPVGPPTGGGFRPPSRRPPPDADHMPPPGFDDMFM